MNELQGLVHDCLVKSGHIECAAIIKRGDGSARATSVGYEVTSEQSSAITAAFASPTDAMKKGIKFNGASYKCIRADKDSIYAKKENSGFVASLTKLYIVYGSYSSSMCPSICVEIVEKVGDYFRAKGK
uniref:Profilin n=1 Tax=Halisarca dujardinii TaxID=2583056 RepID=A0A9E9FWY4_HALDU|nr:profilin 3 [Halisarca dujardinii]